MATEVAPAGPAGAAAEDDEAWLYGDESKDAVKTNGETDEKILSPKAQNGSAEEKKEDREEGEMSGEEESQEKDDEDDDDSDDDVQVTIGDIQTFPLNEPKNLFKTQGGYQKSGGAGGATKPQMGSTGTQKGIDLDAPGTINGVSQFEFDFDSLEEKPWRKPGADITDYFNYGFTEETWVQYSEKQKRLRGDNLPITTRIYVHSNISSSGSKKDSIQPPGTETPQTVPVIGSRGKTNVGQQRKTTGTIDVIGTTARDSRRPEVGDPIPVAGSRKQFNPSVPPPGMTTHPMSGMPPMPDFAVPPPGMAPPSLHPPSGTVQPPGVLPTIPPPGFPPDYDPYYPPPGQTTSSHYDDRGYSTSYPTSYPGQQSWQHGRNEDYRWNDYSRDRDRSPARSDSEFSSSGSEKDYRYGRDRERRFTERDSRDSYRRERDSYRDRSRSRERERDRDRSSRDHRHKEEKHRSRSRKHRDEDDSDHHRSKHKKSKKSKREKDESQYETASQSEKAD